MKKIITILAAAALLSGCADFRNFKKHVKSDFTGLNRRITFFSADGRPVRVWETKAKVEDNGGTCFFINSNGKAVTVSGSFLIEEL
jgi:hypothetical protein